METLKASRNPYYYPSNSRWFGGGKNLLKGLIKKKKKLWPIPQEKVPNATRTFAFSIKSSGTSDTHPGGKQGKNPVFI